MTQQISGGISDPLNQTNAVVEFNYCYGASSWIGTEQDVQGIVSSAGVMSGLAIELSASPGTGDTYTFTLRKNGANTTLTVAITGAATTGADDVHSVALAVGDLIDISCTTSTPATINAAWAYWCMLFSPTTPENMIIPGGNSGALNTGATAYNHVAGGRAWSTTENNGTFIAPCNGTMKNLRVVLSGAPDNGGGTQSYTFSLRYDGVTSALTTTISEAATSGTDVANTVAIVAGKRVALICVPSGTPTARTANWGFTFIPTTAGESPIMGGTYEDLVTDGTTVFYNIPQCGIWGGNLIDNNASVLLRACELRNWYFYVTVAPGVAKTWTTYVVETDVGNTAITAIVTGAATQLASDVVHTKTVTDKTKYCFSVTSGSTPAAADGKWGVVAYIAPAAVQYTKTITLDGVLRSSGWLQGKVNSVSGLLISKVNGQSIALIRAINGVAESGPPPLTVRYKLITLDSVIADEGWTPPALHLPGPYSISYEICDTLGGVSWGFHDIIRKEDIVHNFITLVDGHGTWESIGKLGTRDGNPPDMTIYQNYNKTPAPQDWDIVMFRLGTTGKPGVLLDACLHGDEVYGYLLLYAYINWLITANDDVGDPLHTQAARIMANNELFIIPCLNYRSARSNYEVPSWMAASCNSGPDYAAFGINLNRNAAISGTFPGTHSSDIGIAQNFGGDTGNSTVETQAEIYAWTTYTNIRFYWNLHQYANLSTSVASKSVQAKADATAAYNAYPTICTEYGVSGLSTLRPPAAGADYRGNGYWQDEASYHDLVGYMSELGMTDSVNNFYGASAVTYMARLQSGDIFESFRAAVGTICRVIE